jgi:hypothetical protein
MFLMTFNSTPQSIVDIFLTQKNKNIYNQMASLTFLKKLASCDSYYYDNFYFFTPLVIVFIKFFNNQKM